MSNFTLERNNYRRKLIMLVKQNPILWNKKQENFNRNRAQKILLWHQISEQLDISVDKLRRTWENLRDQYRRDLKREVRYGFKSKWRFFSDMDFIRDMVSCKEHEFKENELTDSDSELDVTDNQQAQTQCCPISTTLVPPTSIQTMSTPCTSSMLTTNTCPTTILPFKPIMLSKQWQNSTENLAEEYNATPSTSNKIANLPAPTAQIDLPQNCDSSRSINLPLPNENIAKQEPDLDLTWENAPAAIEPLVSTPEKVSDTQNTSEFQGSNVSTSCHKRSRHSIEEISDYPMPSTSRSQIKTETDLNLKDDDYYFVMSLLPSLRQIPMNRKFPLRIGIMSLIAQDLEKVCKE